LTGAGLPSPAPLTLSADAERGEVHTVDRLIDLATHPCGEEVELGWIEQRGERSHLARQVGVDAVAIYRIRGREVTTFATVVVPDSLVAPD
jgi:hypothetical protein